MFSLDLSSLCIDYTILVGIEKIGTIIDGMFTTILKGEKVFFLFVREKAYANKIRRGADRVYNSASFFFPFVCFVCEV